MGIKSIFSIKSIFNSITGKKPTAIAEAKNKALTLGATPEQVEAHDWSDERTRAKTLDFLTLHPGEGEQAMDAILGCKWHMIALMECGVSKDVAREDAPHSWRERSVEKATIAYLNNYRQQREERQLPENQDEAWKEIRGLNAGQIAAYELGISRQAIMDYEPSSNWDRWIPEQPYGNNTLVEYLTLCPPYLRTLALANVERWNNQNTYNIGSYIPAIPDSPEDIAGIISCHERYINERHFTNEQVYLAGIITKNKFDRNGELKSGKLISKVNYVIESPAQLLNVVIENAKYITAQTIAFEQTAMEEFGLSLAQVRTEMLTPMKVYDLRAGKPYSEVMPKGHALITVLNDGARTVVEHPGSFDAQLHQLAHVISSQDSSQKQQALTVINHVLKEDLAQAFLLHDLDNIEEFQKTLGIVIKEVFKGEKEPFKAFLNAAQQAGLQKDKPSEPSFITKLPSDMMSDTLGSFLTLPETAKLLTAVNVRVSQVGKATLVGTALPKAETSQAL